MCHEPRLTSGLRLHVHKHAVSGVVAYTWISSSDRRQASSPDSRSGLSKVVSRPREYHDAMQIPAGSNPSIRGVSEVSHGVPIDDQAAVRANRPKAMPRRSMRFGWTSEIAPERQIPRLAFMARQPTHPREANSRETDGTRALWHGRKKTGG